MARHRRPELPVTTPGRSGEPGTVPPLTFHPDAWADTGDASMWQARRRWVTAVREFADAHNVSSYALLHPDSAAISPYADSPRVARRVRAS